MGTDTDAMEREIREVELDGKGRISIGRIAEFKRYAVERMNDGTIVLHPRMSIDPRELAVVKDKGLVEELLAAFEVPEEELVDAEDLGV